MQFSWISISWFLQIPILSGSYRSSECLVRMNYRLNGKGNVVIVRFFPPFAAYPLNKTTDWRMTKFTKEFMIEWVLYTFIYSVSIFDILMPGKGQIQTSLFQHFTTLRHFLSSISTSFCNASFWWFTWYFQRQRSLSFLPHIPSYYLPCLQLLKIGMFSMLALQENKYILKV